MADNQLGPLLRLSGISVSQLPPLQASADDIAPFLLALLQEAVAFVDTVDDQTPTALWKPISSKTFRRKVIGAISKKEALVVNLLRRRVSEETIKRVAATRTAALGGVLAAQEAQAVLPAKKPAYNPSSETWFCRRSRHPNAAVAGSASWTEFRTYLKDNHAASERDMTESVMDAREALVWPAASLALQGAEEGGRRWSHFTLGVYEMQHKVGNLLNDRVFPVLQMTCVAVDGGNGGDGGDNQPPVDNNVGDNQPQTDNNGGNQAQANNGGNQAQTDNNGGNNQPQTDSNGGNQAQAENNGGNNQPQNDSDALLVPEFLVVSVTVNDFAKTPMPGEDATDVAMRLSSQSGLVSGFYASVERLRLLPTGLGDNRGTGLVEWIMATTSDARGTLPQSIQNVAIPREIAKDVPLFFRWLKTRLRINNPPDPAVIAVVNQPQGAEPAADNQAQALQPAAGNQPQASQPATGNQPQTSEPAAFPFPPMDAEPSAAAPAAAPAATPPPLIAPADTHP